MIILDTKKAAGLFEKFDVPLAGYIVNRVIPPELINQDIPRLFAPPAGDAEQIFERDRPGVWRPSSGASAEFERDITGLPMIERVAEVMFGGAA